MSTPKAYFSDWRPGAAPWHLCFGGTKSARFWQKPSEAAPSSPGKAAEFLAALGSFDIAIDQDGTDRVLTEVYRLAIAYHLTGYDAVYLELALRKNLPLATLDEALARACRAAGGTVDVARRFARCAERGGNTLTTPHKNSPFVLGMGSQPRVQQDRPVSDMRRA